MKNLYATDLQTGHQPRNRISLEWTLDVRTSAAFNAQHDDDRWALALRTNDRDY